MSAIKVSGLLEALAERRLESSGVSTTTLNLVAFLEDRKLLDWIVDRTNRIAQKLPSRTILLDGSHTGKKQSVRSEQIQVGVAGVSAPELRSIVRELVVPNVQCVLFWAGGHLTDDRFYALSGLCSSVVIDSSRSESGTGTMRELLALDGRIREAICDLAYMRLLPWQDMVAQFFDDRDLATELPSIVCVEVAAGSDSEAYYFVGWLGSRLGWTVCGENEFCNERGAQIRVQIGREGEARRVRSVRLHSARSIFCATLQNDASDLVCLTVTGEKHRPQRCAPLNDVDILSLLERAILAPRDVEVFNATLGVARTLLEQIPSQ